MCSGNIGALQVHGRFTITFYRVPFTNTPLLQVRSKRFVSEIPLRERESYQEGKGKNPLTCVYVHNPPHNVHYFEVRQI